MSKRELWTIGHSTRTLFELLSMLKHYQIECIVDVRHYASSRKYPHFNKDALQISVPEQGMQYLHNERLGGRRTAHKDSLNTVWRHPAFRGYADYMESEAFAKGIADLEQVAGLSRVAIMCSEAVWWRCHRSMIADRLKATGWQVMHILSQTKVQEHPYTAPAKIVNGNLTYREDI